MPHTAPYIPDNAPFSPAQRAWLNAYFADMAGGHPAPTAPTGLPGTRGDGHVAPAPPERPAYSRTNPFPARLRTNRRLTGAGSSKDTRHLEIDLEGSGLTYEVGDALAVVPTNDPALVDALVNALGCTGDEAVPVASGETIALRDALRTQYELSTPPRALLETVMQQTGDETLARLLDPDHRDELQDYCWSRDVVDVVRAYPDVAWTPGLLVQALRKLTHRLYSISSSPKVHPGEVHLTVGVVRYEAHGRVHQGTCSGFLAERVDDDTPVPVFVHPNKNFSLPDDPNVPIIMIGPGTGIAPFRAFLEERRAIGATGPSWLFFGDRHEATDYLYRDELTSMLEDGTLTRLSTAFSRDQDEKVYVQHRMREQADAFFAWLEDGAHVYVCGDASRMANDVDAMLHRIIEEAGHRSPDESAAYVRQLKKEKRYVRDVY